MPSTELLPALRAVVELALPLACGGCGRPGTAWCPACARSCRWAPTLVRTWAGAQVWAAAAYRGPLRAAIGVYKDADRRDLARVLAPGLAAAVLAAVRGGEPPVLVPVPSSARSRRCRGDAPTSALAHRAARVIEAQHEVRLPVVEALAHRRRVADQARLGREERLANLAGAHRPTRAARWLQGRPVVLVDDVATTGATLAEGARVLWGEGAEQVLCAAVAATPRGAGRPLHNRSDQVYRHSTEHPDSGVSPTLP